MATVLVPLADGFEEIEAVTVIDVLRRAGADVTVAGLVSGPVHGSHGIPLVPDEVLDDVLSRHFDMIVLPGGLPGADNLEADPRIRDLLVEMAADGRFTTAICAAPKVLAAAGLLDGRKATSFPGFLEPHRDRGLELEADAVVRDGRIITSRSAGTAMDFALELVAALVGEERATEVESRLRRTNPIRATL
ncbi:MAG: DJ-1/PfpI family protein [Gammaproteobacteria bacterium]|jgi:4-methyl-5(b-hydroxyethyl)-thiazole monophosphate biosynthesis